MQRSSEGPRCVRFSAWATRVVARGGDPASLYTDYDGECEGGHSFTCHSGRAYHATVAHEESPPRGAVTVDIVLPLVQLRPHRWHPVAATYRFAPVLPPPGCVPAWPWLLLILDMWLRRGDERAPGFAASHSLSRQQETVPVSCRIFFLPARRVVQELVHRAAARAVSGKHRRQPLGGGRDPRVAPAATGATPPPPRLSAPPPPLPAAAAGAGREKPARCGGSVSSRREQLRASRDGLRRASAPLPHLGGARRIRFRLAARPAWPPVLARPGRRGVAGVAAVGLISRRA
ncbi:hypothetical protein QYE76_006625 [Lolium multiflorum]|uniref:Uncharacterized protein n=1 Tax=Lolium multiflorum TaxID=4521 RepID=A0AAD8W1X0_LOLMU|nr:hypothetical protein QYE76_006625 [Lolium multiflorum]